MAALAQTIEDTILAALQTPAYSGLSTGNVVARAAVIVEEGITPTLPCLILAPSEQSETWEVLDFEGGKNVTYHWDVVLVAAYNRDPTAKSQVRLWREQAIAAIDTDSFVNALAIATENDVWNVTINPDSFVARTRMTDNITFSLFTISVSSHEQR